MLEKKNQISKKKKKKDVLECYRTPRYFAQDRNWRWGTVFWNLTMLAGMPPTGMHANTKDVFFILFFLLNVQINNIVSNHYIYIFSWDL